MSSAKYSPLATDVQSDTPPPETGKFKFPKITRLKIVAFIVISLLTILLVTLTCLQRGMFSGGKICNVRPAQEESPEASKNSRIRFSHTKRHLPHCIIIGVRKAGTRALLAYLNIHSDIVTAHEEIHFFDDDEFYKQGLEAYRKQMPYSFSDQLTIEKTPAYFTEDSVPERIYRMNKTIKMLLIVRDPVARVISDYAQLADSKQRKHKPLNSFEHMVIDKHGDVNISYKAIRRSLYYKHLAKWLEFFPLEQIHLVDGDSLVESPYDEVAKVETFLGVAHLLKRENFYFNSTKGFFCIRTEEKEKCLAESKGRKHPDINPRVVRKLREFYEPYNQRFFSMIGRSFDWS